MLRTVSLLCSCCFCEQGFPLLMDALQRLRFIQLTDPPQRWECSHAACPRIISSAQPSWMSSISGCSQGAHCRTPCICSSIIALATTRITPSWALPVIWSAAVFSVRSRYAHIGPQISFVHNMAFHTGNEYWFETLFHGLKVCIGSGLPQQPSNP